MHSPIKKIDKNHVLKSPGKVEKYNERKHRLTSPHRLLTDTLRDKDNQKRPETNENDDLDRTALEDSTRITRISTQATKWNAYLKATREDHARS